MYVLGLICLTKIRNSFGLASHFCSQLTIEQSHEIVHLISGASSQEEADSMPFISWQPDMDNVEAIHVCYDQS